jgi:ribokinase
MIEVVGLGALNIDHLYQVERILEDGETVVKGSGLFPGGSAANTIYGLAKLGVSTGFAGAVGDDAEGKMLRQDFQQVGVDTSQIKVKQGKTGSVLCLSDKLGRRSLYVLPGANSWLIRDDLNLDYLNQAKVLHISSFADDRQFKLQVRLMDEISLSTRVSFSPGALYSAKGLKALAPILARTHVLFLNQGELRDLTNQTPKRGAQICLEQGCGMVVVTLGEGIKLEPKGSKRRGTISSYIKTNEQEYTIESQNALSIVDTTGAGDAFAAGFLYGLLKGKTPEECGQLGNIVASFSLTKLGARQGLPTLNELAQRYQQLYHKQL